MAEQQNGKSGEIIPPLSQIEKDGARAAHRLAQKLVDEARAGNGALDVRNLNDASDEVRIAITKIQAEMVMAPNATVQPKQPPKTTGVRPSSEKAAVAKRPLASPPPRAKRDAASPPSLQRTKKHWLDRRRQAPAFKGRAMRQAWIAAALLATAAVLAIKYLRL